MKKISLKEVLNMFENFGEPQLFWFRELGINRGKGRMGWTRGRKEIFLTFRIKVSQSTGPDVARSMDNLYSYFKQIKEGAVEFFEKD